MIYDHHRFETPEVFNLNLQQNVVIPRISAVVTKLFNIYKVYILFARI